MSTTPSRTLAYLRLCRLPNVFTAIADIWMGYLVVHGAFDPQLPLIMLTLSTGGLYTAGMVLNDVFDVDIDRRERPQRPLPSGQIPLRTARQLGYLLLFGGWLAAGLASFGRPVGGADVPADAGPSPWSQAMPLIVASLLAVNVLSYNAGVKRTWWGPWNMGMCRLLNILLGMSLASPREGSWLVGWGPEHFTVAVSIGLYITGVTWFARGEAGTSSRSVLALGGALMAAGWLLLATLPYQVPAGARLSLEPHHWQLLLAMLAVPVFRRALVAWQDPSPQHVQTGVKQFIVSLIVLDATVVLLLVSPTWSILVLALLIPMLLLGRWVYST